MATKVDIQYNPFLPQLTILINGKEPPDYSRLIQFVDEDIWKWHSTLLDVLYSEIRDDYYFIFSGTDLDITIMRFHCEQDSHCIGFTVRKPYVDIPLQKRLGELNQIIKKNGVTNYCRTNLDAYFTATNELQSYLDDILYIDINNLFCTTKISIIDNNCSFKDKENSFLFVLALNCSEGKKIVKKYFSKNPIFLICQGSENKLKEIHSSYLVYECNFDEIIATIFNCFLGFPLILALRNCVHSIEPKMRNEKSFLKVVSMDPVISIEIKKTIELGKSNRIRIVCDPELSSPSKVIFKILDNSIATTDNMSVFGIKPGKTQLEAYYYGSKKPFQVCDLHIIQRNRIKKIILDNDELVLGVGDIRKMYYDFSPVDADNVDTISWKSTDEKIVSVDTSGTITCNSCGKCNVICIAENVSAVCKCEVLPYLESISVELPQNDVNNQLNMEPMQEYELQIKTYPVNSIDKKYSIISSDYNVVNVLGNKILAKKEGIATIDIINTSKRKRTSFIVKVSKPKRGFFKSLFGG